MAQVTADALERARRLRLMVFDVDGVLTDGRLWFGPEGEALKVFQADFQQTAALAQWYALVIEGIQQIDQQRGIRTRRCLLKQSGHLIAGKGAAYVNALQRLF